ncbi:MAG: hypothetical protein ACR2O1_13375 [Boseongicola sp.]
MIDDPKSDETLEALFKAARGNPVEPHPDFLGRLMEDADSVVSSQVAASSPRGNTGWTKFAQMWLPASGLTAAAALGVWIGLLLPDSQIADAWLTNESSKVDLTAFLPGADLSQFADPEADG